MTTKNKKAATEPTARGRGRPKKQEDDLEIGHLSGDSTPAIALRVFTAKALLPDPEKRGALAEAIRQVARETNKDPRAVEAAAERYNMETVHELAAGLVHVDRFLKFDFENRISGFMDHHKAALLKIPVRILLRLLAHPSVTPGAGAPQWLADCINNHSGKPLNEFTDQLKEAVKQHR